MRQGVRVTPAVLVGVAVVVASAAACTAVPDLVFVSPSPSLDAAADGGPSPGREGGTSAPDAGAVVAPDAAVPACPTASPVTGGTCCGTVTCVGDCASNCTKCAQRCGATDVCCALHGSLTCLAGGPPGPSPCP